MDCNATTPVEPEVQELVVRYFSENVGNAGSRTHEFGQQAKNAVQTAREQVASLVAAKPDEVLFTSGATESNNIALLGLTRHGEQTGRQHIVSTAIEHKAVLEPLEVLERRGFEVTLVPPDADGLVPAERVLEAIRSDTLAVSVMHVNNETGVTQPVAEIAAGLEEQHPYLHVDAAQSFGKVVDELKSPRIDLISASSHKVYGPIGVGVLIARRRRYRRPPLEPLIHGGGQERGLRPGTLPTPLIAGFGLAAELAEKNNKARREKCLAIRRQALAALQPLGIRLHGNEERLVPHVLNLSIDGLDSEAVMLSLKGLAAVSNGSACTSTSYEPSHVLQAMGLSDNEVQGAIRFSWCHLTPDVDWAAIRNTISGLQ
nr:cysteine desulfurase DndA [Rhodovibrio sodomensis]